MKGFHPISGWKMSLKKKGANDIVDCTEHALGFAILLGGVGTRKSHMDPVSVTKLMKLFIVKFFAIITLEYLNGLFELILNICVEMKKFRKHLRFLS